MLDDLLIKANDAYKKFSLGVKVSETERSLLRREFKNALYKAVRAAEETKKSPSEIRDMENRVIAGMRNSGSFGSPRDLLDEYECERLSLLEKRSALDALLRAKGDMNAFQEKYRTIGENEKIALLPKFMEFDDRYNSAKERVGYYIVLEPSDDEFISGRLNELASFIDALKGQMKNSREGVSLPRERFIEGGVVSKYMARLEREKRSVPNIDKVTEQSFVSRETVQPLKQSAPISEPISHPAQNSFSGNFFQRTYSPVDLSEIEHRIAVLSNRINEIPSSKLKLGNTEVELLTEKIRLQSQLEIAKLMSEFEQIKTMFNSQLHEIANELNNLRAAIKTTKDDIEDIKFNSASTRRARNAAQSYAIQAAKISKKLSNIIKYLSNDANISGGNR